MTMAVLEQLGLEIGPRHSLIATNLDDNPHGYLEQRAFVELADELLGALGGRASLPAPAQSGWHLDARFAEQRARAAELAASTFEAAPWGWKDPRAALLLPFWRSVMPDLRVLICVRNPAEVTASMMRRNAHAFDYGHWLRTWLRYTADALADSAGASRMVVLYDDLLAAPESEARRLGTFVLGMEPTPDRIRAAASAVRPATRRHSVSDAALIADARTPAEIAAAYLSIRAAVHAGEPLDMVTRLVTRLQSALGDRVHDAAVLERTERERDTLAIELERVRARHAGVVGSRSWRFTAPLRSLADRARSPSLGTRWNRL
jgi:hypothetical protein